jgi:hypothetical protein
MADQQLNIRLNAIDNATKALNDVKKELTNLGGATNKLSSSFLTFKNAIFAVTAYIGSITLRNIINTTTKFQDLRTILSTITKSTESGAEAFRLLNDLSKKSQFDIGQLSNTFITLYNAGINPTEKLLKTFIDTANRTAQPLDTLNDLTRLFAKSTEGGLNLQSLSQLANNGIPVFSELEKKLGLTRDQIQNFAQSSKNATLILNTLLQSFNELYSGTTEDKINNLSIAQSILSKRFADFEVIIGGEFQQSLVTLLNNFGKILETAKPIAIIIGETLNVAIQTLNILFEGLNKLLQFLIDLLKELSDLLKPVTDLFKSLSDTIELYVLKTWNKFTNLLDLGIKKYKEFKSLVTGQPLEVPVVIPQVNENEYKITPPDIKKQELSFLDEIAKKFGELISSTKRLEHSIAEGMVKTIGDFSRGIAESIVLGKSLQGTLKGIAQTILIEIITAQVKEIAVLLSKLAIVKAIAFFNSIGGSSGGNFLSSLFKIGSSFFGGSGINTKLTGTEGSFAEGGAVRGGMPITVGERGRELFVPNTSGTIVPNHDLAKMGNHITFNIQANDVRGIRELLIDNRATIINLVNQGANQKGKSNLV